jgi:L-histidine N-alpha-methyltransferase
VDFAAGEELLTEISTKFSRHALRDELEACGLAVEDSWVADGDEFVLTLARRP